MARNFGSNSEIRIPPESTGPRIINSIYQSISLTAVGGTVTKGMDIVGQTSSANGIVSDINGNDVLVEFQPESPVQAFTDGETVDINNTSFTATANSPIDVYANNTQVVDGNNPYKKQKVSQEGSAQVRYVEGEQQMDALGVTRVTPTTVLDSYRFQYSEDNRNITDESTGAASVTHLPDEASVDLTVTTAAADSIIRTTDIYYPYVPGVGRGALFTLALGDTGKTDNTRRWGIYDDNNGVFFELNGTTFRVVVRSSTSGSAVDTAVAQTDWNVDVLDGTGGVDNKSGVNLDLTSFSIYWMDYAWLGTGRVRFGIYTPSGDRVVCHVVENANANPTVFMTTGTLPLRWENANSGLTSGNSTLKLACASVHDDSFDIQPRSLTSNSYVRQTVSAGTGGETVMFNLRTATTFNSLENRITSLGVEATAYTDSDPVIVRVYENATIGGSPSWGAAISASLSPLEVDTAGTVSSGSLVASTIVGSGQALNLDLDFLKVHLDATGSTSKTYSITAESIGAAASDTSIVFSWVDLG